MGNFAGNGAVDRGHEMPLAAVIERTPHINGTPEPILPSEERRGGVAPLWRADRTIPAAAGQLAILCAVQFNMGMTLILLRNRFQLQMNA